MAAPAGTVPEFDDPAVAAAFAAFPDPVRMRLLDLRALVFRTAADTARSGALAETLKWGQPAYLTQRPKTGSTLRLGLSKSGQPALFAHCRTSIVADFQAIFPRDFLYEGERAVVLKPGADISKLRVMIAGALTYHLKTAAAPR